MNYKKTLENSIKRKSKFIDDVIHYHKNIPLFSWIEISPIDACNRKCIFCPKSDSKIAPDTFNIMENKYIEKLANELKEMNYKGTVVFAGYGEPMLDKKIFEKISILSGICNVEITTNGDALTKTNIIKLVQSGINKIVVSLYDGPEQIDKFKKLFISSGIKEDKYILRDRWYKEEDGWGLMVTNRAGTLKLDNKNLPQKKNMSCYYTHYSMMIDWNGNCYLCTQDWQRKIVSGNIFKQHIFEIWNSEILKKYRINLGAGNRTENPCVNCNAYGLMHGSNHFKAWKKYYRKSKI